MQAFEQGAIDYLVKPFDEARLADTVARLQQRLVDRRRGSGTETSAPPLDDLMDRLAQALDVAPTMRPWLQWIKASVGSTVRLIPVEQIAYLRSDEKYTLVVWEGGEALIRKTIRELADELDPQRFVQIHRSVIVALSHVAQVTRGLNETAEVQLKGRPESLPVSRSYLHVFRQM